MTRSPAFTVALDARSRTMRVTAQGLWSVETVDAYQDAISAEIARYVSSGGQPNSLDVLIDVTAGGVQQSVVAERLKLSIAIYLPLSRRIAIVITKSALKRMQVRRTMTSPRQRIFDARAEADAWLREPEPAYKKAC